MNMSYVVGALVVLWVVGILGWMWYGMQKGYAGVTQLYVIRVRIATVIGGLISILLIYATAMLNFAGV